MGSRITEYLDLGGTGELQGAVAATQCPDLPCRGVIFKAAWSNTGNVYLGKAGVTKPDGTTDITTGLELAPGEATPYLPCHNINEFYRICDNAGDDLTYVYWT